MPSTTLTQLVAELNAGELEIVDLTQPLGPATPVIGLPPMFAPSPGVSIEVISRYDDGGPAWYWNTIRMGEHTGTHFDAPVHWISGRDLAGARGIRDLADGTYHSTSLSPPEAAHSFTRARWS